jgi:hypothetical protein
MIDINEELVKSMFVATGFKVSKVYVLENKYWPFNNAYLDIRAKNPWFLLKTQFGLIEVGRRKRVIQLDWTDICDKSLTPKEGEEWITNAPGYVHSYSNEALVANLFKLHALLSENKYDINGGNRTQT